VDLNRLWQQIEFQGCRILGRERKTIDRSYHHEACRGWRPEWSTLPQSGMGMLRRLFPLCAVISFFSLRSFTRLLYFPEFGPGEEFRQNKKLSVSLHTFIRID
jgi:hypothetical protein